MALPAGTRLGTYEILSPLGAGGMGEVYRGRDTKLGREVAIKVLPEEFSEDGERLARFEREAKLLAQLNHSNVATLHGLEESNGRLYLVMELVEGETLAERLARGPIPLDEARAWFLQIAEGLEAAHEKGIVHRDLKPANVKITPEGKVKILDFGLARLVSGDSDGAVSGDSQSPTLTKGTALGVILGTAAYMSPEQARGKSVDKRTDMWAFGCCLFEALSARKAFTGETVTDILASVVKAEPPWSHLPPTTPSWTKRLLERCLTKDPRHRLHDVADARIEIEEGPSRDSEPSRPSTPSGLFWVGALLVTAVLTAIGTRLVSGRREPAGESSARTEIHLRQLTGRADSETVRSAALSPNGESLAFVTEAGLFLQLVATGEEQRIPLPEELQIHEVDWLAAGSTLLFSAASGGESGLYKASIFGGTPTRLADNAGRAAVAPDGQHIATCRVFLQRSCESSTPTGATHDRSGNWKGATRSGRSPGLRMVASFSRVAGEARPFLSTPFSRPSTRRAARFDP